MTEDIHICSVVVYVQQHAMDVTCISINALTGAEVHGVNEQGKIVVSIEADNSRDVTACIDEINKMPNVFSVQLVFQANEEVESA